MAKLIDLTGKIFGRLTVISRDISKDFTKTKWICKCECGNIVSVFSNSLMNGGTKSCKCLRNELIKIHPLKHGETKNNKISTEYISWRSMKSRCLNPNNPHYKNYGGRGIKICERWLGVNGFNNFISDMGYKPSLSHSLDRFPNNDGHYEPSNCRWSTEEQQNRNRRSNRIIEFDGKKMLLVEWGIELGVRAEMIAYHMKKGKSMEYIVEKYKKMPINASANN